MNGNKNQEANRVPYGCLRNPISPRPDVAWMTMKWPMLSLPKPDFSEEKYIFPLHSNTYDHNIYAQMVSVARVTSPKDSGPSRRITDQPSAEVSHESMADYDFSVAFLAENMACAFDFQKVLPAPRYLMRLSAFGNRHHIVFCSMN